MAPSLIGFFYALFAFIVWGLVPIFWRQLKDIPSDELLAHRVIWGCLLLFIYLGVLKKLTKTLSIFKNKKKLIFLILTSLLIQMNWLLFIYAINKGHIIEVGLGYYINPLMNVVIGVLFLGETLRRFQWFAIALVTIGIMILLILGHGEALWVSFILSLTFATYAYLKKLLHIEAAGSLFLETTLAFIPICIYFVFFTERVSLAMTPAWRFLLLGGVGAITVIPLICYNEALLRLKYTTLGIMQYLTPTLQLICGVFLYHETFNATHIQAFSFIWVALIIYTLDALRFNIKPKNKIKALKKLSEDFRFPTTSNEVIVFGGSFNPWHQGHRITVELCHQMFPGSLIMVTPDRNPFKDNYEIDFSLYDKLVEELQSIKNCFVYPKFILMKKANPTVDWLPELPYEKKWMLLGEDSFQDILLWKEADRLLRALTGIVVSPRLKGETWFHEHKESLLKLYPHLLIKRLPQHPYEALNSTSIRENK